MNGLLGQFNHDIEFPADSRFVVLHGPNGVGKTKLLELVSAILELNIPKIGATPFQTCLVGFSNGAELAVKHGGDPRQEGLFNLSDLRGTLEAVLPRLTFSLTVTGSRRQAWTFDVRELEPFRGTANVRPSSATNVLLRDLRRRISIAGTDLDHLQELQRITVRLASGDLSNAWSELAPPWLKELTTETDVHLIETQRLLIFENEQRAAREADRRGRRNTVAEFAEDLSKQISVTLAKNSRTSQQLDGSFPRRVLSSLPPGPDVTDDLIRERYESQRKLREALNDISVLDDQEDLPLPGGQLETWQRRVLWTYLEDTERKLDTFQQLLDRLTLLRDIVNSRFLNKFLVVDRDRGFVFRTSNGQDLDPAQLSSGEQHELVLMYDLLFNVKEHGVVLIDEPEISLHVAWQQKFLEDIQRIADLSNTRFIIATHSPQIIHKWWSHAVALGPGISLNNEVHSS